jgi:glutaminyl-peptide cyclotransferase
MKEFKHKVLMRNKVSIVLVCAWMFACTPENPVENTNVTTDTGTNTKVETKTRVVPPNFNADSAFAYVKFQADLGPRIPGSKAHENAVNYYEKQFKKFGAQVLIQSGNVKTFDGKNWLLQNVIASFNVANTNRILLCSHYDSRPFCEKETDPKLRNNPCPGVNDGASGVGVLMEIARNIQAKDPNIGIDIVLFDLEDYGDNGGMPDTWCLGSQYWSKNPHKVGYTARYGILLDMVGAKDAKFPREGVSVYYAGDVVNKVWKAAKTSGASGYFIDEETGDMTDDHTFVNSIAQIPTIDILHYDAKRNSFFEHHHRSTDNLENIDKNTLQAVGQTLLEVIYNEN